jgi:hypothetical protein
MTNEQKTEACRWRSRAATCRVQNKKTKILMIVAVAMAWLFAAYVATGCVIWYSVITLLVNGMTPTFLEDT